MAVKKKKKIVNNPARAVATVSIPSKPRESGKVVSEDIETTDVFKSTYSEPLIASTPTAVESSNVITEKTIADMSSEELEQHLVKAELQIFVDEHGSKVLRDASRQATRLVNERRQSRQAASKLLSETWLTDELITGIFEADNEVCASESSSDITGAVPLPRDDSEVLATLWTLHEVIRMLQLPNAEGALAFVLNQWSLGGLTQSSDMVLGLEEALTWYSRNLDLEIALQYDKVDQKSTAAEAELEQQRTQTVIDIAAETQDNTEENPDTSNELFSDHATSHISHDSESEYDSDNEPDDLLPRWLELKTKQFELDTDPIRKTHQQVSSRRERVALRIQAIERDMLFDKDSADLQWRALEKDMLMRTAQYQKSQRSSALSKSLASSPCADDGAENEGDILGPLFDSIAIGEDDPTKDSDHSILKIHDYGIWNGVAPRIVLEETWNSKHLGSRPQFRLLWKGTNSFQSAVDLQFSHFFQATDAVASIVPKDVQLDMTHKSISLSMRDIATTSLRDSESYVSTIAIALLQALKLCDKNINLRMPKVWKSLLLEIEETKNSVALEQKLELVVSLQGLIRDTLLKPDPQGDQICERKDIHPSRIVRSGRTTRPLTFNSDAEQVRRSWLQKTRELSYQSIQPSRMMLPIYSHKSMILEVCSNNQVTIICADTGAGKSTQIPSYLLEARLEQGRDVNILVTQPRRISAISIARRVSQELGEAKEEFGTSQSVIGYAIRLENKTSQNTRITFATTGVLLRMLQGSASLDHLDYLVLDEVHERTMDLDLIFVALKRVLQRRSDLKLVLMSATVDATKFSRYFDDAPIIDIPGRTFPVEVGFLEDAIEATNDLKLTYMVEKSREDDVDSAAEATILKEEAITVSDKYSSQTRKKLARYDFTRINYQLICDMTLAIATLPMYTQYSQAILIFMPGIAEIRRLSNLFLSTPGISSNWTIHMLHSSFSTEDLEKAFVKPAYGCRKIVIATNIAETGITIPDVTAVIDTCREKIMRFDERRQLSRLTEGLIARSSARQRRGRAARVQPGLCFHLVTRYQYEHNMMEQSTPEMMRLGLQEPILRVKTWGFGSIEDTFSAAIDPPTSKNIRRAISKLQEVGALDIHEELTDLGRIIARLPVDVALSRLIAYGLIFNCLDAMLTITALMSSPSIYQTGDQPGISTGQMSFCTGNSDLLTSLRAYTSFCKAQAAGSASSFCRKYHLSLSTLSQVEEQRVQLLVCCADAGLLALTSEERATLNRARKSRCLNNSFASPPERNTMNSEAILSAVITLALHPKLLVSEGNTYRQVYTNQHLHLASTSVNRIAPKPPRWVCYVEAMQNKNGRSNAITTSKVSEASIILLVGHAEFRLYAGVINIDNGRIKFAVRHWRHILALKTLRTHIASIVADRMKNPSQGMTERAGKWFDILSQALTGPAMPSTGNGSLSSLGDGDHDG